MLYIRTDTGIIYGVFCKRMCGLVGFLQSSGFNGQLAKDIASGMGNTLAHRGPDDDGIWVDGEAGVALAHRRLSVIDLSTAGHQPMTSCDGRFVLVYNGEIYNHLALREELENTQHSASSRSLWNGKSDTETLLMGFAVWGIKATIERCIGMFAFAVWDKSERRITLGRDRLGEKPLYYGWQGDGENACFLFGSELKALKAHPSFRADINRDALALFMRHNYIPAPHSIYTGIHKLQPGQLLTLSAASKTIDIETYWSMAEIAVSGTRSPLTGSAGEIAEELERMLRSAVKQQMLADVPLGAFLSGGIDSSAIVALMQSQSASPIKTFTIGFNEQGYNEAGYAKAVAAHLGTDHTDLYVTPDQALDVIARLPELYCEPFADSSQIATVLVCELARRKVTVSLSGDAGDELFAGYNRYIFTQSLWSKLSRVPRTLRLFAAHTIRSVSPSVWNFILGPFENFLPQSFHQTNIGFKLHKGAQILDFRRIDDLYFRLISHLDPAEVVIGGQEPFTVMQDNGLSLSGLDDVQRMMVKDSLSYLPDDILVKVDRAAMGASLESRMPFLDHRIVEYAWRIPQSMKLRDGNGKWILRQVLHKYIPKELIDRPKMGFGVPIDTWLRGPLRDWAEALLDEQRLKREGYFHVEHIRTKWAEHLSGKRNWQYQLWNVLMFQSWLDNQTVSIEND